MANSAEEETFLTVAEVAEVLKLNQQTVRNWIDQGSLPALRVGRRVRIKRSDFERLLESSYSSARASPDKTAAGVPNAKDFWSGNPFEPAPSPDDFWGGTPLEVTDPYDENGANPARESQSPAPETA